MLSRPSPRPSRAAFLFAGLLLAGAAPALPLFGDRPGRPGKRPTGMMARGAAAPE